MKKTLLLGGSHFQIPSILKAKELGYYTITCDYIPDNPGHKYADEYYNVSTTDKEAVLALARELDIDGIVCYASDPAAPTAAYVAEQMGLPTSPYESVELLSNKDKFRDFLRENGFNVPKSKGYSAAEVSTAEKELDQFVLPVMVKPVDSSGSKGVSKVSSKAEFVSAVNSALEYSRSKRFIVEEYVEKYGYQIAGDGFSVDGRLVFRCFANEHFDAHGVNPYVPIGESWPYAMPSGVHAKIHDEVQRALDLLNMGTQAYNFDIRIDENENVYLMELGPRNGGNLIPQLIEKATGVDMVEYTIRAAMGEDCNDLKMIEPNGYWSSYVIHSNDDGILREVRVDPIFMANNVIDMDMYFNSGDMVESFKGSNGTLGMLTLRFDTEEEMLSKMDNMDSVLKVVIE